jgi:hypothetical protein
LDLPWFERQVGGGMSTALPEAISNSWLAQLASLPVESAAGAAAQVPREDNQPAFPKAAPAEPGPARAEIPRAIGTGDEGRESVEIHEEPLGQPGWTAWVDDFPRSTLGLIGLLGVPYWSQRIPDSTAERRRQRGGGG